MNWQEIDSEIKALASKCSNKPEIIIAVVRGGLIPARLLAKYLEVKDMYCLTVSKRGDKRVVLSEIKFDLTGKNILLVEDVLVSGKSLIAAKEYLEDCGASVKTASIYYQPQSRIKPNYSMGEITDVPIFPWD